MASNKKWFKRALRTLSHGETQLWNLIKTKLVPTQVEYLEKQFMKGKLDSPRTEKSLSPSGVTNTLNEEVETVSPSTLKEETTKITPQAKKKTTSTKKRTASRATKKKVAKKIATTKEK